MKQLLRIAPVALISLLLAACSPKAHDPIMTPATGPVAFEEIVERVNANRNRADIVTGRMSLDLSAGKQKISVGGNIKMKRNDVIQLSIQVFGFVEAGRIEMTQDYILILNRIGKQYVKVGYRDVPFFKANKINFFTFQSLIWNELFVPGSKDEAPMKADFERKMEGDKILLTHTNKEQVVTFLTAAANSILEETTITPHTGGELKCTYKNWTRLGPKDFPDDMDLKIQLRQLPIAATLQLSKLHADEKWKETRTDIDRKKLRQINLQQAFNQILSLTN